MKEALKVTKPDDHPDKWQINEHTRVKHQLFEKYLKAWISIMGRYNTKLGYIDGFAGRGIYETGEKGSPILAMRAAQEQINKIGKLNEFLCVFIEKNYENFCCLQEQVSLVAPECPNVSHTLLNNSPISFFCNEEIMLV